MNMRLLIFGDVFSPPAFLPRLRYFCSYFLNKGYDINLIFEKFEGERCVPEDIPVFSTDYYKYKRGVRAKIEWVFKFLLGLFFDYKGYFFYKKSQQFLSGKNFDVVFCTSPLTFPLTTAARVAKKNNIPLFVDLRDIPEQSPDDNYYMAHSSSGFFGDLITKIYKRNSLNRRNRVLKMANGVTSVSPFHIQTLSNYNSNTHLIYNGFDELKFIPEDVKTDRFTISYFGRVYNEKMRNPGLLFEALKTIGKKREGILENTVVKWFIDENSKAVIEKMAGEYGLSSLMEYCDFVEPDGLSAEMNKSSIFLILCNVAAEKRFFGMMTTKFFEALGTNRPILCIPDNKDNLAQLIRETNSGLVTSDVLKVESFLLEKFTEWQKTGMTKGLLDETTRMNYSRKQGAEILENLFINSVKNK